MLIDKIKKIIFFLLGLLLPISLRILVDISLRSTGTMWPLALTFGSIPLIFMLALPLLVLATIANIYGHKNKPIFYSYTVGMIIGITIALNLASVINYLKYNWGIDV